MEILTVDRVTKRFGDKIALNEVSLSIPQGALYGLLGPNGAGKTTLIRIINRITAPDSGTVMFCGKPIMPEDIYKIGYLPEERGLYKKMRVGEQAIYFARLKGLSRKEATCRLKEWFIKFEIQDWWDKKVEELSKGMAQKIQFIVTILHQPKLLIFDEPFSGFDPINAQILTDQMMEMKSNGATIIFSTHNMDSVEQLCDHITLINNSKNILSGEVDKIRHQHGNNIFQVDFKGDKNHLHKLLEPHCIIMDGAEESSIYDSLKIQVEKNAHIKDIISLINDNVEIRSYREIIPSMNDIFIKAVKGGL